jgi:hypothetical protein
MNKSIEQLKENIKLLKTEEDIKNNFDNIVLLLKNISCEINLAEDYVMLRTLEEYDQLINEVDEIECFIILLNRTYMNNKELNIIYNHIKIIKDNLWMMVLDSIVYNMKSKESNNYGFYMYGASILAFIGIILIVVKKN